VVNITENAWVCLGVLLLNCFLWPVGFVARMQMQAISSGVQKLCQDFQQTSLAHESS
jgi:hypothetical protein